jgi:hypothetical protein
MSLSDGDAVDHCCGAENGHPLLTKKREEAIWPHGNQRGQRLHPKEAGEKNSRGHAGQRQYRTAIVVVLVTDGEETCGGAPCALGQFLKANSRALTVHVIGYQLRGYSWTGAQSILDVECLAETTGGFYITAKNRDDLVKAFEKTLGCPMMSTVRAWSH